MKISWRLTKEAGIKRPHLSYKIELTPEEISLNPIWTTIKTTIPLSCCAGDACVGNSCLDSPTAFEHWEEIVDSYSVNHAHGRSFLGVRYLWIPLGPMRNEVYLAYKPKLEYPEVEKAFKLVREEIEKALLAAANSIAFEKEGELGMTEETANTLAPVLVEKKLLNT